MIRYVLGPDNHGKHHDPHVIAGFRPVEDLEPARRSDGSPDFRTLDELMMQPLALLGEFGLTRPVWHYPIRAHPDDPILTDEQWAEIAREIMHATGLAKKGDDDGCRWFAVRHADDHIHLVATLARQDGQRPDIRNDAIKGRAALRRIERKNGFVQTAPADRTAAKRPTRGETEQARRHHRPEAPRVSLRRHVITCAAGARSEKEFFSRLQDEGVLVKFRHSRQNPDQITGYAVALPADTGRGNQPIYFSGGRLAPDLTLPKLRARWSSAPSGHDPNGPSRHPLSGAQLSVGTAKAVLRQTVRTCAAEATGTTDFLTRLDQAGLLLRVRHSDRTPGQVTGYAVTLPGHRDRDDQPRWYSGGQLADDLTLPRLTRLFNQTEQEPDFTHEELQAIYNDAARAADHASDQIRRCITLNPQAARDAAWAASDVLHVAAQTTGNPHLHRAARAYDRAARAPDGRTPKPTRAGEGLRTAARVMAMAGLIQDKTTVDLLVLVAGLTALTGTVAQLRAAEGRRAQAEAAARSSAHLRYPDETSRARATTAAVPLSVPEPRAKFSPRPAGRRQPRRG
ncbi:relaxase/mobilization nuclease domain-containing protein [Actinocorallia aurantiaca]|uniref:relaxase/mobilization nuclease domain-containing protein n=1 Tax=Actinocorallia aurantiaca TaxID=46204 RepID=UPI0031D5B90E